MAGQSRLGDDVTAPATLPLNPNNLTSAALAAIGLEYQVRLKLRIITTIPYHSNGNMTSLSARWHRPLRIEYDGALYHVTSRGNDRKAIFKDDRDRELFLNALAWVTRLSSVA